MSNAANKEPPKTGGQHQEHARPHATGTTTTILVALIGLFAALVANVVKGVFDVRLEKERFTRDVVLRAIDTPSQEQARNNLRFFIRAGLLDSSRFSAIARDTVQSIPTTLVLPATPDTVLRAVEHLRSFADFRDTIATVADAQRILQSAGLTPEQVGPGIVTSQLAMGWRVTIWTESYGNARAYGVRYGPSGSGYEGSNVTYFEILAPASR